MSAAPLLKVEGLKKHFPIRGGLLQRVVDQVHAVDGVSFELAAGETLGLVGESGCGKSTTGRCVLRLIEPTAGEVHFEGRKVADMQGEELRRLARDMQIIFQDPFASLNPRMTVAAIVGEGLLIHTLADSARAIEERVVDLLETVGLAADQMRRYPHEFSGGQRQRIAIARALGPEPELIVADEPLSALDVSIQSQILNLMSELREQRRLSYLFISHDLSAVHHLADRVAVMYLGRLVEVAPRSELFALPVHPYTRALLDAIPRIGQGRRSRGRTIKGDLPSPLQPPSGCAFHPRCPKAQALCKTEAPQLLPAPGRPQQLVACHFKD